MLEFVKKHRTKILGALQVTVGGVMTYLPNIQSFLKPMHYGLITMAIGVTTGLLGFFNTLAQREEDHPQ